ncbi:MAG: DUF3365 domain-containing protein [Candidatus Lambdaproteobacteria bacterium]|nr:DUF3365 domain-containing protein [Candidatus Lambdaproteobacteria bacterium]
MKLSIVQKFVLLFSALIVVSVLAVFFVNKRMSEQQAIGALIEKARAITIEAENARNYMGRLRGTYKAFDDGKLIRDLEAALAGKSFASKEERIKFVRSTSLYWTIPIVAGWTVGQTNAEKANYEFRVPKIQPRNPKNEPDAIEREMLLELGKGQLEELYRIDPELNALRFMRPIKLDKNCMGCHGTKDDDHNGDGIDPLGFEMENWKEGEVHGAFEVVADLAPMQAGVRANLKNTLLIGGVVLLAAIAIVIVFVRRNITNLLNAIKSVMATLVDTSTSVSTGIDQMSGTAKSLADGASSQAASLEETSSTIEQMASMTRMNAENAKQAEVLAGEASQKSESVGQSMVRMKESINEIKASSDQTAVIIKTIDEIAFQTNLLALNAAVEAARAGDAGRGFAVVAEEVRNLAQRSAEAARNTNQLLEVARQRADAGVSVATEVGSALNEIFESIDKVSGLIKEVAAASTEQSRGIEQVNLALTQMESITQNNAASAEENSSTTEEMTSQVGNLSEGIETLGRIVGGDIRGAHTLASAVARNNGGAHAGNGRPATPVTARRIAEAKAAKPTRATRASNGKPAERPASSTPRQLRERILGDLQQGAGNVPDEFRDVGDADFK